VRCTLNWRQENLGFVGLPDPEHSVLKLYGQEIKLFKLGRMPAQVIVDKQGQARYVHYGHSMQDIPPNQELLALLAALNGEDGPDAEDALWT
jgi:peroxiredoxin Q/BCP